MRINIKTYIILCLWAFTFSCFAQTPTDSAALRALQVGYILPPERVYLHFDNTAYFLGETIWFKAFVTSNNDDRPTTLSRVLYVEFVAPEGYVVKTNKYKIGDDGTCNGEIYMDPLYLSGYYEVRAYTRYMLNWGDEAIFSRVFPVFDKVNNGDWGLRNILDRERKIFKDGRWKDNSDNRIGLTFYPESGHLVNGIESRVAYELRNTARDNINKEITITANEEPLLKTTPEHLGKGVLTIKPDIDTDYNAVVETMNEEGKRQRYVFKLPKVEREGVAIRLLNDKDSIRIFVNSNYNDTTGLGFVLMHRSSMGFYKKIRGRRDSISIDKNEIPEGVNRAIVFNGKTPVAERLFFVRHNTLQRGDHGYARLLVTANGQECNTYEPLPHEKIVLRIEREDGKMIDDNMEFAVSVSDGYNRHTTFWGHNLYTYLLLGSELKGFIPDAWQYFDPKNHKRDEHLDLIMLTHGWTAYEWQQLTQESLENKVDPEEKITIRGKFYRRNKINKIGKKGSYNIITLPYNQIRLDFADNGKDVKTSAFRTDSMGDFIIEFDDFYGKEVAALSPTTLFKQNDRISYGFALDKYFSPQPKKYSLWELASDRKNEKKDSVNGILTRLGVNEYQFPEITIKAKREDMRFYINPISELRLDYLDEWEYASDVTFLNGIWDAGMNGEYLEQYNKIVVNKNTNSIARLLGNNGSSQRYWDENHERKELYQYQAILTAEDVIFSAHLRHALGHSFWTHFVITDGEYHKDSVPLIDENYLHGIDVEKMTNFKEIIITSDRKKRELIEGNSLAFWKFKKNAHKNKLKYKHFYNGFLSPPALPFIPGDKGNYAYRELIEEISEQDKNTEYGMHVPDTETESKMNKVANGLYSTEGATEKESGNKKKWKKSHQVNDMTNAPPIENPNRVVLFVPHEKENATKTIQPDLSSNGTRRYTSVQGYTASKKFYSPDYSNMAPESIVNDYRRTLMWSPTVKPENGRLIVEFYNSSLCKSLCADIIGYHNGTILSNSEHLPTINNVPVKEYKEFSLSRHKDIFIKDSIFWEQCNKEFENAELYYLQKRYGKVLNTYIELIQYGYSAAYRRIGEYYRHGLLIKANPKLAVRFFSKGAELGDIDCYYELSELYRDGIGVEQNRNEEINQLQIAAKKEHPSSLARLGKYYNRGIVVEKDSMEAKNLLRKAAMLGNTDGLFEYGICLHNFNIENDSVLGTYIDCIKSAAGMKHIEAMQWMMRHEESNGNQEEAYRYAKELYLMKDIEGTMFLAGCYMNGYGCKRNKRLAKDLYREAAAAGSAEAKKILEEW